MNQYLKWEEYSTAECNLNTVKCIFKIRSSSFCRVSFRENKNKNVDGMEYFRLYCYKWWIFKARSL